MSKLIAIFIDLIAISTRPAAQEIVTDRPDQTESSTTVPAKNLQTWNN
jgi:hypothetical protein